MGDFSIINISKNRNILEVVRLWPVFDLTFHTVDLSLRFKMQETENIKLPCGYEEDFTSPVDDDLQCLICQLPLREPVLTRCGHRFCRQCLEKHMARLVLVLVLCLRKRKGIIGEEVLLK